MAPTPENDGPDETPDGAAVFPLIPPELGVSPLMLGLVHAYVFLSGSDEAVVNGTAAGEALEYLATYLQRLCGAELQRAREDLSALAAFAKSEKWPKQDVRFLNEFLKENGVE